MISNINYDASSQGFSPKLYINYLTTESNYLHTNYGKVCYKRVSQKDRKIEKEKVRTWRTSNLRNTVRRRYKGGSN